MARQPSVRNPRCCAARGAGGSWTGSTRACRSSATAAPSSSCRPCSCGRRPTTIAPRIQELFLSDFGHLTIVAFGEVMHADQEAALVAEMKDDVAGALAYRRLGDALHIVALATDPMWQRSGVGGYLLAEAELLARARRVRRASSPPRATTTCRPSTSTSATGSA